MAITLAQFLAAIAQQESGGSYSARNSSSGAIGKYQVMPSNVASWTKRALGHSLTAAQFAASPSAQEAVANTILGGYFKQYGAAGAAAMWYSGQPDPNKSYGDPPVSTYVNEVLGRTTSVSATTTTSGGVTTTTAALDPKTLAEMYGLSYNMVESNKELKNLFSQAVKGDWTADVFTAHLKNTQWWATQSDTTRQYITLKYTDPATFTQKWTEAAAHINSLSVAVGLGNLLSAGSNMATMNGFLKAAVIHSMKDGWSDDRVKAWLGASVNFSNGQMSGQAAVDLDKLHAYAYENGLSQSSAWYLTAVRDIEGGKATSDGMIARLRQMAASKYSAYSTQILAGQNALDIAAPFTKAVSDLLEIDPASVDLTNKYVAKAMTAPLKAGAMPGSQYTLWQLQNDVRNDPLWRKTDNARESTMSTARQVGQIFGATF